MPFIPGVSTRTYTPEQLEKLRAEEKETKIFGTKEYTTYEATQQQRALERQMRAQREKIDLLKQGGADPEDITVAEAKYRTQLYQYRKFSEAMGIQPQMERVYYDMRGRVIPYTPKYVFQVAKSINSDTIKIPDTLIHRSVGAKAKNYDVLDPKSGRFFHFAEGTRIQNSEVFAGYKTNSDLKEAVKEGLTIKYGGLPELWQHAKGTGIVDMDGEHVKAELHWFQQESIGKVGFTIKKELE